MINDPPTERKVILPMTVILDYKSNKLIEHYQDARAPPKDIIRDIRSINDLTIYWVEL